MRKLALAAGLAASLASFSWAGAKIYSVSELKAAKPKAGRAFWVEGFISKTYVCPPCPEGAQCKPCMKDNVVLSQTKKKLESYADVKADDLIVFTADSRSFAVGRKRRLKVKITDRKTTSEPINDVEVMP
jgi:hypothetical protein